MDYHILLCINHLVCFILNSKEPVSTLTRKITYFVFTKAAEKLKRLMSWDYFAIIFFTIAAYYFILQRSQMILVTHHSHYSKILYCRHWWIPSRRQKHQWILTRRWQQYNIVSRLAGINGIGGVRVIINTIESLWCRRRQVYSSHIRLTFYSFSNKFPYYIIDNLICGTPEKRPFLARRFEPELMHWFPAIWFPLVTRESVQNSTNKYRLS